MAIPSNLAFANLTNNLVAVYKQIPKPSDFLGMFFKKKESSTRYLTWAVRREGEPVAVNVLRGTEGNRNTFSISTDKIIDAPYYREYFDLTQTDLYYRAWNSALIDKSAMDDYMSWAIEHMQSLHNKIKRAEEVQRAQFMTTGIVTLAQGASVDFGRSSASMPAYSSAYNWNATTGTPAVSTVNPFATLAEQCKFLRTTGKVGGGNFIVIMGDEAKAAFDTNTFVLERQKTFNMKLDDLKPPFREANGSAYHGRISAGDYTLDVFTYPEYRDVDGTPTAYLDPKKVIVIPENPVWYQGYAAVPFLPKAGTNGMSVPIPGIKAGQYVIGDYIDQRNTAWIMDIKSASIVLPTAIDMVSTNQVVAP